MYAVLGVVGVKDFVTGMGGDISQSSIKGLYCMRVFGVRCGFGIRLGEM